MHSPRVKSSTDAPGAICHHLHSLYKPHSFCAMSRPSGAVSYASTANLQTVCRGTAHPWAARFEPDVTLQFGPRSKKTAKSIGESAATFRTVFQERMKRQSSR